MTKRPILWSFRRCPYAMRARLAIYHAKIEVELREILLKDKPADFVAASPKATVPVVETTDGVIEESRDAMAWALSQSDPMGLWSDAAAPLLDQIDGPFKTALDHTKYAVRYPHLDAQKERQKAADIIFELEARLSRTDNLLGHHQTIADIGTLPFVRQFANTDRTWFDAQNWPNVHNWLGSFLESAAFSDIMRKYPVWTPDQPAVVFPN